MSIGTDTSAAVSLSRRWDDPANKNQMQLDLHRELIKEAKK